MRGRRTNTCAYAVVVSLVLLCGPVAAVQGHPPAEKQLLVDDDGVECPDAGFTKIQDAINAAASGAKIRVCPGTYSEQVSVPKALKIVGDNGAIVMPGSMVANSTSLATGNPIAAVILVVDAEDVTLNSLIVDGAGNAIGGCSPDLIGIYYQNASGSVEDVAVRNIRLSPGLEGCQSGVGILVQSGAGQTSQVSILGSSVHDFQKNGITGNELGTQVSAKGNVVSGIGPTSGAAQNGIQIGFGARGEIAGNHVANHIWSRCVSPQVCAFNATNILVFQSDDVTVKENVSGVSQLGIAVIGDHNEVRQNTVFGTLVFDGIAVLGDANQIQHNSIIHSDEAGIFLDGNNNVVTGNRINEAPIGILKSSGSVGSVISGNQFFNTPITVQDPPSASVGQLAPYR